MWCIIRMYPLFRAICSQNYKDNLPIDASSLSSVSQRRSQIVKFGLSQVDISLLLISTSTFGVTFCNDVCAVVVASIDMIESCARKNLQEQSYVAKISMPTVQVNPSSQRLNSIVS